MVPAVFSDPMQSESTMHPVGKPGGSFWGALVWAMIGSPKKTACTPNTCAMTPFHSGGYSAPMAGESPAFKPAPSGKRLNCRIMTSQSSTGNGGWGSRAAHQLNTPSEIRETECESWQWPGESEFPLWSGDQLWVFPQACVYSANRTGVWMKKGNLQGIWSSVDYTYEMPYCAFSPEGAFPSRIPSTSSQSCGPFLPQPSLCYPQPVCCLVPPIILTLTSPLFECLLSCWTKRYGHTNWPHVKRTADQELGWGRPPHHSSLRLSELLSGLLMSPGLLWP